MSDSMFDSVLYFGMFTEAGNRQVYAIVEAARKNNLSWSEVYDLLLELSSVEGFGEATDTAVREYAYEALMRTRENDEPFFV